MGRKKEAKYYCLNCWGKDLPDNLPLYQGWCDICNDVKQIVFYLPTLKRLQ